MHVYYILNNLQVGVVELRQVEWGQDLFDWSVNLKGEKCHSNITIDSNFFLI